jgi:hypothetical protein
MIDSSGPVEFIWVVGCDNNTILSAINPPFLTKKKHYFRLVYYAVNQHSSLASISLGGS